MKELSLHILDLVQNSITASASRVDIIVEENTSEDKIIIEIIDNGKGMPQELIQNVTDPFVTSRTNRRVGLGISLFKSAVELCDGSLDILSSVGKGTTIKAECILSHIDRVPLGDMAETMVTLICANPNMNFGYKYIFNGKEFYFDTKEVRTHIEGISIDNVNIILWIKEYIQHGVMEVSK